MHPRRSSGSSAAAAAPSPPSAKDSRSAGSALRTVAPDGILSWSSRPAHLHAGRFAIALLAMLLTVYVALVGFQSVLMALVGVIAIAGAITEGFFPVHHRLSDAGASTRCGWQMRQMSWESVKSARIGPDGIHLSPLRDGSRLGRVRGVTLRFDGGSADEITSAVRSFLKGNVS